MIRLNVGLILTAVILMALSSVAQAQPSKGEVAAGKSDWSRVGCYACHGSAAQGLEATGPQLSGRSWTFPAFNQLVRHPVNSMPPFTKKVLSDIELSNLMSYVNSVTVKKQ